MYDNYLMHEGNEHSGRYPLGSGKRPYQHRFKFKRKTPMERAEAKRKRSEIKKQKLYLKGTAQEVYRHRELFTPEELHQIVNRIDAENAVAMRIGKKAMYSTDAMNKTLGSMAGSVENGIKLFNNIDKVSKIVNGQMTVAQAASGGNKQKKVQIKRKK